MITKIENGTTLLVNKPLGWTSFDVVNKIKFACKKKLPKLKIGHAGTLDPLAEGLLIICTGKNTKTIESIQNQNKTYIAEIFLGATRPSFDKETDIDKVFDISDINIEDIYNLKNSFEGPQMQTPPIYSAIKQNGKPIYLKARKGLDVVINPREIFIYKFDIIDISLPLIKVEIECSKGTYIRTIANDIGKLLNNGAYLNHLVRTKIGDNLLTNSFEINEIIEQVLS